jgi:hypothetical protein
MDSSRAEEERQQRQRKQRRGKGRDDENKSGAGGDVRAEEQEEDYMGFSEAWEVEMVRFWRCWNLQTVEHPVRETDIQRLVRLGRTKAAFGSADAVAAGARKLATLLPDAHIPNMLQREPAIVDLNFARASQSILQLQTVLCSSDHCSDVTAILVWGWGASG